jgi:hypothetical protein
MGRSHVAGCWCPECGYAREGVTVGAVGQKKKKKEKKRKGHREDGQF